MFFGHLGLTIYDARGQTVVLGCTCGRIFWQSPESVLDEPPTTM
jgi:hypothetical protein